MAAGLLLSRVMLLQGCGRSIVSVIWRSGQYLRESLKGERTVLLVIQIFVPGLLPARRSLSISRWHKENGRRGRRLGEAGSVFADIEAQR